MSGNMPRAACFGGGERPGVWASLRGGRTGRGGVVTCALRLVGGCWLASEAMVGVREGRLGLRSASRKDMPR